MNMTENTATHDPYTCRCSLRAPRSLLLGIYEPTTILYITTALLGTDVPYPICGDFLL